MNPILQQMMPKNNMLNQLRGLKQMLGGNPQAMYDKMLRENPQFKSFVEANQNKSPEQIAKDYGIDFNQIRQFFNH